MRCGGRKNWRSYEGDESIVIGVGSAVMIACSELMMGRTKPYGRHFSQVSILGFDSRPLSLSRSMTVGIFLNALVSAIR